jgi:DNA-binding transcriptional ArsR family regulator
MPNDNLNLDRIFQALTDPTRRAVLERLGLGPAAMKELAHQAPPALRKNT